MMSSLAILGPEGRVIRTLPESICNLKPRKRLDLSRCTKLACFPETAEATSMLGTGEQSNRYTAPEIESSLIDEVRESRKLKCDYIGWQFALSNIILEAISAYFEQESSPKKPCYALIAMLMAFVAVVVSMVEFIHKAPKAPVASGRQGYTFVDILGLICAVFQFTFSIVQYACHLRHVDTPVKVSLLPLIFAICAAGSRFFPPNREPEALPPNLMV